MSAAFSVLGQTYGPENRFYWVVVPLWKTAIPANDENFKENEND